MGVSFGMVLISGCFLDFSISYGLSIYVSETILGQGSSVGRKAFRRCKNNEEKHICLYSDEKEKNASVEESNFVLDFSGSDYGHTPINIIMPQKEGKGQELCGSSVVKEVYEIEENEKNKSIEEGKNGQGKGKSYVVLLKLKMLMSLPSQELGEYPTWIVDDSDVSGIYSDDDGSENVMVVDEGEHDFNGQSDGGKFDHEFDQASLKLRDSNDETETDSMMMVS